MKLPWVQTKTRTTESFEPYVYVRKKQNVLLDNVHAQCVTSGKFVQSQLEYQGERERWRGSRL